MASFSRTPSGSRSASSIPLEGDGDVDVEVDSPESEGPPSDNIPETSRQRRDSSSSWSSDAASGPEIEDEYTESVDVEMAEEVERTPVREREPVIRPLMAPFANHRRSAPQIHERPQITVPPITIATAEDDLQADKKVSSPTPSAKETCKLMVDYLISEGFREVAEALCNEAGIVLPVSELKLLDSRVSIRNAIVEGRLDEAIHLIDFTCPDLMLKNSDVRFHLHQQNVLEMIRAGQIEKVLVYAEKYISGDKGLTDEQLERLEKTFALLAFEDPTDSPFAHLLSESHRQMVSTEVNSAVLRHQCRPAAPRLEALLRMIVWAEKQIMEKTNHPDAPMSTKSLAKQLFDNFP